MNEPIRGLSTAKPTGVLTLNTLCDPHQSASLIIAMAFPYQGMGHELELVNWVLDWAFRFGN
jgi:RimJ/RimL family protein N-acetyltransferase